MQSIHARLLLAASLVLATFMGFGALALDQAFKRSAEAALRERLQEQVYALLGTADDDPQGRMRLPDTLPDPQYSGPDSGLYAEVIGEQGAYHWRSSSMLGRSGQLVRPQPPGSFRYDQLQLDGESLYLINFGLSWEDEQGRELAYTLAIARQTAGLVAQVDAFRNRLFYALGGVALLLLLAQGVVLAWSLRPLRRIAIDLEKVEAGQQELLRGRYPTELRGVVRNLNSLIRSGRASRDRYRNSLGDLAHSLKTPLTLLRGMAGEDEQALQKTTLEREVQRMDEIIQYQLQRAATAGVASPGTIVQLRPVARRLGNTLLKVYQQKQPRLELDIPDTARFLGEQADLMELLGNVMDNAFKYCRQRVRVSATADAGGGLLLLSVEDDGPGIDVAQREQVLRRGVRIDQQLPGQGIGLSVAAEIVRLYRGALSLESSPLGGTSVRISFDQAVENTPDKANKT